MRLWCRSSFSFGLLTTDLWRREARLGDGHLLGKVVEASDVVDAALTHHAGQVIIHLNDIRQATGLKRIMGVTVKQAGAK